MFRDKPDGRGQEFDRDGKGQEFDRDAKRQEGGKRVGEKGQRVGATREGDGCLLRCLKVMTVESSGQWKFAELEARLYVDTILVRESFELPKQVV